MSRDLLLLGAVRTDILQRIVFDEVRFTRTINGMFLHESSVDIPWRKKCEFGG